MFMAASSISMQAARTRRSAPFRATSISVCIAGLIVITPRHSFTRALISSVAPTWREMAYCRSRSACCCGGSASTNSRSTSESFAVVPSTASPGTLILWPTISLGRLCAASVTGMRSVKTASVMRIRRSFARCNLNACATPVPGAGACPLQAKRLASMLLFATALTVLCSRGPSRRMASRCPARRTFSPALWNVRGWRLCASH